MKSNRHPVGIHQLARLLHMGAQHLAEGGLQQMSGGMVAHGGGPGLPVHLGGHRVALLQLAAAQHTLMKDDAAPAFKGVGHLKQGVSGDDGADIPHLAAAFRVEGRFL